MIKFKNRYQHKANIDITSLVDLVFLLIAFFMITSSLSTTSSISVQLPRAVQTAVNKQGDLIISVDKNNNIFIDNNKYELNLLSDEINRRKPEIAKDGAVVIRGDRNANYETIVKIMDILNRSGLPKFSLTTINSR